MADAEPLLSAEPLEGGCRWLTTYEHSFQTASLRRSNMADVTCCGCKARVAYTLSYVTVPYGQHGNRLPLPVFVHCSDCALKLDPQLAWMAAYQKDAKAALPDPEKVKREEDLNRQLNPILNPDLLP